MNEVVERWGCAKKIANLASSIASGRLDSKGNRILALRTVSCHGSATTPPCPSRRYSENKKYHYCRDCGCNEKSIARLSDAGSKPSAPLVGNKTKLHFRVVYCPRRRPGFSNSDESKSDMQPYLIHIGWRQQQWQRLFSRAAEKLGLGYSMVLVEDNIFNTASLIKKASLAVIWNGSQHYAPLAKRLCALRNIPFVVYEWGLLPQKTSFIVDPQGLVGDSILCRALDWVTDEDMSKLKETRESLQAKYPLAPKSKRVLVLLQIENDSQILYHSRFNSMKEFIEQVEQEYAGYDIVIRPHPKTANAKVVTRFGRVDASGDMFDQVREAELVVSVSSTGLYESAVLGVPVKAYGNHPVTHHTADIDRLAAGILALRLDRESGDLTTILDRFNIRPKVIA